MNHKSSKTKHSKVKNTGLLFEFLLRQLTVDVINGTENGYALNIIKKRDNWRKKAKITDLKDKEL